MRNKKLSEKFKDLPCIVCGMIPSDCDHIINFAGDSEKDIEENCWPLCRYHHIEKGYGLKDFVDRYDLQEELLNRSMWFDGRRWRKHFSTIKT